MLFMNSHSRMPTVIVQARMGASRLPGKPLLEVLGRPLLSYLIERLKRCNKVERIAVATSCLPQDDPIVDVANKEKVAVIRGDETDVLSRYWLACQELDAASVVRITADCPMIDPPLVDVVCTLFMATEADYVSNTQRRTYPRGFDVEVFTREALEKSNKEAIDPEEREHVTLYIRRNPQLFQMRSYAELEDLSHYRFVVDTQEDFEFVKKIMERLYPVYPSFRLSDILKVLKVFPELTKINAHIQQRIPKGLVS